VHPADSLWETVPHYASLAGGLFGNTGQIEAPDGENVSTNRFKMHECDLMRTPRTLPQYLGKRSMQKRWMYVYRKAEYHLKRRCLIFCSCGRYRRKSGQSVLCILILPTLLVLVMVSLRADAVLLLNDHDDRR
jgi:hypothetical protein